MSADLHDRIRGCLLAGAAGDALGYAVEFSSESSIFTRYGERGITEYELENGLALISDDTQMTMFTAEALIFAYGDTERSIVDCLRECYLDWYKTQTEYPTVDGFSRLIKLPELYDRRAPGNTCLDALSRTMLGLVGTIENPLNSSKGCGGVMRVAPIGLINGDPDELAMLGARAAVLTHGHELGYIPAAALAYMVKLAAFTDIPLYEAAMQMLDAMKRLFPGSEECGYFVSLCERAIGYAKSRIRDLDAIHRLGEGWVGEEAFAIALFSALRYSDDIGQVLISAVNHGGDSDSTGAIAGNIIGARLGESAIPAKFLDKLELRGKLMRLADDINTVNRL